MRRWLLWLTLGTSPVFGLTTAYVSFDHPQGWQCELSQGIWICQSNVDAERKEAVVLSIATMATEWDTIDNYEDYLKQPRTIQVEDGTSLTSEVRYVRKRNINGHVWIDSLQYNAELPGFWARYVATVHETQKAKLAILITYIVSDEKYKQLAPLFDRMIASLKPNAEFDLNIATRQGDGPLPGSEKLGPLQHEIIADRLKKTKKDLQKPGSPVVWWVLLGAAGGGAYYFFRVKRKKKPPANQKPIPPNRRVS
jgi:hypothetical protein